MVLVIPHIPKTGGQTLRYHFDEHLKHDSLFIHAGPWGDAQSRNGGKKPWINRINDIGVVPHVILGHYVEKQKISHKLERQSLSYATCLRDPADRWESSYNFQRANGTVSSECSFWEYFANEKNANAMINFIWHHFLGKGEATIDDKFKKVSEELDSFEYVGTLDRFDDFSSWVTDKLCIPHVIKRRNVSGIQFPRVFTLDAASRSKLYKLCAYDLELYNLIKDRS